MSAKIAWMERCEELEAINKELLEAGKFTYDIISKTPQYFAIEYQEIIRKLRQAISKAEGVENKERREKGGHDNGTE